MISGKAVRVKCHAVKEGKYKEVNKERLVYTVEKNNIEGEVYTRVVGFPHLKVTSYNEVVSIDPKYTHNWKNWFLVPVEE